VNDLSMAEKRRLGVALALLDEPRLIVVDDADTGPGRDQQRELFTPLRAVADTGPTVAAACAHPEPAEGLADVVALTGDEQGPAGRHARALASSPAPEDVSDKENA